MVIWGLLFQRVRVYGSYGKEDGSRQAWCWGSSYEYTLQITGRVNKNRPDVGF